MAKSAAIRVSDKYLTIDISNVPVGYLSEILLVLTPEKRQELIALLQTGIRGEMKIVPQAVNFENTFAR
jgi:hypothetical protein